MENPAVQPKKGFFQNDRSLVCSMLVFYSLCIVGLVAAAFWWLNTTQQKISAKATATAALIATQQAQATSTVIARSTEQAQYEFIENFDRNSDRIFSGNQKNEYYEGAITVEDGIYSWEIEKVDKTFVYWGDIYEKYLATDFDAYLDVNLVDGPWGDTCGGLIFRKSSKGWNRGAYTFSICNDSHFEIYYHGAEGWDAIVSSLYTSSIRSTGWNRIETSARGDTYVFTINNQFVFEMSDARQKDGGFAIFIEIGEKSPASIQFDNFGFQSR